MTSGVNSDNNPVKGRIEGLTIVDSKHPINRIAASHMIKLVIPDIPLFKLTS